MVVKNSKKQWPTELLKTKRNPVQVKWVVEQDVFDGGIDSLFTEIHKQGMDLTEVKYIPFQSGKYECYPDDNCVLFYGSLNLARQIQREKKWVPGVWIHPKKFHCSYYYAYLGQYLLNKDYIMLPLPELHRRKQELFKYFKHNSLFVRPDSGFKTFVGQTIHVSEFNKVLEEIEDHIRPASDEPQNISPAMVVVSSPKQISAEWRFVAAKNKIIAGSQYRQDGNFYTSCNYPTDALKLAQEIAGQWQPDPMHVIDVCKSGSNYYLLEVGCFSAAGFYKSDPVAIVTAAKQMAIEEWESLHGVE